MNNVSIYGKHFREIYLHTKNNSVLIKKIKKIHKSTDDGLTINDREKKTKKT